MRIWGKNMENKLLVGGSAIAVIILVLATLSPVVGYHTVKSNSFKDSPLFSIRMKRVIGQDEDALTCEYVGKGQLMPFPSRDNKAILIQKLIDRISSMNEREYNFFVKLRARTTSQ